MSRLVYHVRRDGDGWAVLRCGELTAKFTSRERALALANALAAHEYETAGRAIRVYVMAAAGRAPVEAMSRG